MEQLGTDSCRGTVPMEPPMPNCSMGHQNPDLDFDDTGHFLQGASCTIAATLACRKYDTFCCEVRWLYVKVTQFFLAPCNIIKVRVLRRYGARYARTVKTRLTEMRVSRVRM